MSTPDQQAIAVASNIAETVLFPRAIETDASPLVPLFNLDALADAGLYGLVGPRESGGIGIETYGAFSEVAEALASGCLTTTFVWIQHQRPVGALASSQNATLRDEFLSEMCAGRVRAGVALGGLRFPAQLSARRTDGGWLIDGVMPWTTGWGRIDLLYMTALTDAETTVCALVDARESDALRVTPLRLVAANASGTVEAVFKALFVPDERVVSVDPFVVPPAHDGGGRPNGSLSLGVVRRCAQMIAAAGADASALDAELVACRARLDAADEFSMGDARAAATELAVRSAVALVVAAGSRSLLADQHGQRLVREATFLLGFGTRPTIRAALLQRLGAAREA